ncbi:P-loop containing nucleoside triphosphate hydrolase protein [Phanerochaete sordida]|uniref:P-loop containing nucleoside triphosphate hydrolase protein n=1 Tax=Phanerochaete sordida TaxID=48140 RepID=A0A9P3L6M1_9APHY|nr:P-loop containing nucleoside triphosphate hydrolase protein [Phanerochaete sordida]
MADDGKGKKRRGRPTKAAAVATSSRQRTLRDMFGGGSKASQPESSESQPIPDDVIELSDSEREVSAIQLSTPGEAEQSTAASASSSLPLPLRVEGTHASQTTNAAPAAPKKLFPMFEKRKTRSSDHESAFDVDVAPPSSIEPVLEDSSPEVITPRAESRSPSVQIQDRPKSSHAGSSRDAPIVIEPSSPELPTVELAPRPTKPVYSIFARPARAVPSASKSPTTISPPEPSLANQPLDLLATFPVVPARFRSRDKGKDTDEGAALGLRPLLGRWMNLDDNYAPPPQRQSVFSSRYDMPIHDHIDTIPASHHSIPSISRLLQLAKDETPSDFSLTEQWAERWRPRQAGQVLGNDNHALYLRDWLQALRLQGESLRPSDAAPLKKAQSKKKRKGKNKKPDVVRHVKKRRRDGLEDDFFAPDDFTESEDELQGFDTHSSDWDDIGFCQQMDAKLTGGLNSADASQASTLSQEEPAIDTYKPTRFGHSISNTILLSGPSGSGKTAAVYACAAELGWEVFEVYPGIGERSGAELNKLIGDVGKNHTVKVHQSPKKTNARASFFEKPAVQTKRRSNPRRVCDSEDELDLLREPRGLQAVEDEVVDVAGERSAEPALEPTAPTVNQSVILIEEADILYHTDTNFWPALINIIKHCRRPVVLACNDVSLIPRNDLPLQATLEFRKCPSHSAASYLQAVCLAEKRPVDRTDILDVLEKSVGDLRHALQQLQVGVGDSAAATGGEQTLEATPVPQLSPDSSPLTWTEGSSPRASPHGAGAAGEARVLRQVERQHELHSFVDAWLTRERSAIPHGFFEDDPRPGTDDPLGYAVLDEDVDTDHVPVSPYHTADVLLASELLQRVRAAGTSAALAVDDPDSERAAYLTRVGPLLKAFRAWTVPATDAALHLDYAPWLRYIVAVEKEQRAVLAQAEAPGGSQRRRTRNSQKTEQSWLSLNSEERGMLATSGFSM